MPCDCMRRQGMFCGTVTKNWTFSKRRATVNKITAITGEIEMKKSALFFDIDGTILSEITKKIPESALAVFKEAKQNGHALFINTGRTYSSVPAEIKRLDFDGYLCGCGTYLVYHDEVLLESHIEAKRGREIIDKMYECHLDGVLEGTEDIYFPLRRSRFESLETSRRHFQGRGLGREQFIENGTFIYDKLFVYADEQGDRQTFFDFIAEDMEPIDRGDHTYEVVQKRYSKATACEFMLKYLGMEKDQAYIFGDSTNDLSMFAYGQHTVAMGAHAAELEPYTEFITRTVEEDGIAYAMKHYGLIADR